MPATENTFPPPAVLPDLRHALGGIWRLTLGRAFAPGQWKFLIGLMIGMGLLTWASTDDHSRREYLVWVIEFYLLMIIPSLAFLSGAALVREDMKPVAVDYLLSRPIRRPVFVAFRYLSHLACTQFAYLLVLATVLAVGAWAGIPDLGALIPRLFWGQILVVTGFLALGFCFGAFTARYLVLGIGYAGLIELGLGNVKIQISQISLLHHIRGLLAGIRVDTPLALPPESAWRATVFVLLYATIALGLAALFFSRRELVAGPTRES